MEEGNYGEGEVGEVKDGLTGGGEKRNGMKREFNMGEECCKEKVLGIKVRGTGVGPSSSSYHSGVIK